ncbi:unnamed protein product [Meganyctiphanes norvegica]|uniref:Uncharacterized protein n=1 Tax=Meganyctiphanes norvegica TaxID=48144 RepID=A0AAV2SFL9_MEGNR
MLFHCLYQYLNWLLPSKDNQNQINLQNKCAQRVNDLIRDKKNARKVLAQVPPHLFKLLFQTQVLSFFSEYKNNSEKDIPESLIHILLHWPHKNFIFSEELPPFPPLTNDYAKKTLSNIHVDFLIFCGKIATFLRDKILNCLTNKEIFDKSLGPLQHVDFSGPHTECRDFIDYTYLCQIFEIKYLTKTYSSKFKMIDDLNIILNDDYGDVIKIIWKLCDICSETDANSVIRFNCIRLHSSHTMELNFNTNSLIPDILRQSGCQYLLYDASDISEDIPMSVLSNLPVLRGLRIQSYTNGTVSSLPSMQGLEQLHISNINLNGKLDPLCHLDKGLTYLGLNNCSLKISDLVTLTRSPHVMTLRQLDLSCNDLAEEHISYDFILFKNLDIVEILDMSQCNIQYWPDHLITKFVDALTGLNHLSFLNFEDNHFSPQLLTLQLARLGKSQSLKYLSLGVIFDENCMAEIIATFSEGLNSCPPKNRFQVMRLKQYDILAIANFDNLKQ